MSKEKNLEEISVSFQRIANSCKSQYGLVDDGTGWEVTNLTDALLRISEGLQSIAEAINKKEDKEK